MTRKYVTIVIAVLRQDLENYTDQAHVHYLCTGLVRVLILWLEPQNFQLRNVWIRHLPFPNQKWWILLYLLHIQPQQWHLYCRRTNIISTLNMFLDADPALSCSICFLWLCAWLPWTYLMMINKSYDCADCTRSLLHLISQRLDIPMPLTGSSDVIEFLSIILDSCQHADQITFEPTYLPH